MAETLGPLFCGLLCIGTAILAVTGVVVLLLVNRNRSREKTVIHPNWPTITGRITVARVEDSVRTRADDDAFFYPSVEFEYTAGGRVYTGKQAVGRPFNLEFKSRQTLAQYPPGSEVVVYYNPENPDEAQLAVK